MLTVKSPDYSSISWVSVKRSYDVWVTTTEHDGAKGQCIEEKLRRRLGASGGVLFPTNPKVTKDQAEQACGSLGPHMDNCITDVLMANDPKYTAAIVKVYGVTQKTEEQVAIASRIVSIETSFNLVDKINAYECYKDGNTFKGWLPGASKPALTTQNNILSVCVTGVSTAVECKEFWDLSLKQGSKAGDVRVDDGANKKRLITSVFGVQAIKDTNQVDYKGCAAQLLLDASYFDSATPETVTLSGSVRMGLAVRRRLLRDSRSLSIYGDDGPETAEFDVDVDRLQGSVSGVTMTSVAMSVLISAAAISIM